MLGYSQSGRPITLRFLSLFEHLDLILAARDFCESRYDEESGRPRNGDAGSAIRRYRPRRVSGKGVNRKRLLWLLAIVGIAVLVAVQVTNSSINRSQFIASADIPTVAPGVDVLAGIALMPLRIRGYDYRRDAFGDSWTDDNPAPGGHNGCDTRNDILDRDLVDKSYVSIKRCPTAVATGLLHDPYTNAEVAFTRGEKTGAAVQIDHIVPLALAWDLGARFWTDDMRLRFANDPANLHRRRRRGESGQGRPRAGDLDAAEHGIPLSVRHPVHRGAARLRASDRRAFGDGASRCCRNLPDGLNARLAISTVQLGNHGCKKRRQL